MIKTDEGEGEKTEDAIIVLDVQDRTKSVKWNNIKGESTSGCGW